jgi:hypothetical protein
VDIGRRVTLHSPLTLRDLKVPPGKVDLNRAEKAYDGLKWNTKIKRTVTQSGFFSGGIPPNWQIKMQVG